jgi:hypothetical protein
VGETCGTHPSEPDIVLHGEWDAKCVHSWLMDFGPTLSKPLSRICVKFKHVMQQAHLMAPSSSRRGRQELEALGS